MQHDHHHDHHHHHGPVTLDADSINRAFIWGIAMNFLFVVLEVITGLYIHSLSLLSDAGHNLADVGSLALSLLAFRLVKVKANDHYTYGYRKTTILVALFNAVVLLMSLGAIGYEAIHRLLEPEPLPGFTIAAVAAVGIGINTLSAFLFMRDKEKDLNVKSAWLHLLSDAIVSAGLVLGGIILHYTGWYWIDPVLSLVVAAVILGNTWSLLRDSLRLSLDGVPTGIDLNKIREEAQHIKGVVDIHHLHVWAISTSQNALTAHLLIEPNLSQPDVQQIKDKLKHSLEHMGIQHATLETEVEDCLAKDC
jgi:cobalt-zinc-cadmium efflux system protein